jgi:hypothetical protein
LPDSLWRELPGETGPLPAVDQTPECIPDSGRDRLNEIEDGVERMAAFGEEAAQVRCALCTAEGGFEDAKPRAKPTPERGRDQQLPAPPEEAAPSRIATWAAKPLSDRGRTFA